MPPPGHRAARSRGTSSFRPSLGSNWEQVAVEVWVGDVVEDVPELLADVQQQGLDLLRGEIALDEPRQEVVEEADEEADERLLEIAEGMGERPCFLVAGLAHGGDAGELAREPRPGLSVGQERLPRACRRVAHVSRARANRSAAASVVMPSAPA